ncbi:MAG: DUF92 domain-containing protein [Thermoplasmata archaeon]
MVLGLLAAGIGMVATVALAAAAVVGRALTPTAGAIAAAFGIVIVILGGFPFLILLALFVGASALATRYRFEEKRRQSVQEGVAGERGLSNVLAHILVPTGLAIVAAIWPATLGTVAILFASALAFGGADTFASEFGVLSGHARSIFTLRPVAPGTNGGVSAAGEAFAVAAAIVTATVGLLLFFVFRTPYGGAGAFVGIVAGSGFLGCQVDSIVGEALENRGVVGKGGTNFLAMLATVAIAFGLVHLLGAVS